MVVEIPKVYKANNKLAIYVPYDVVEALGLKEGDDLDFLKYGDGTFLVAKKVDIVKLLSKPDTMPQRQERQPLAVQQIAQQKGQPTPQELALLKKLDTIRYADRTESKVNPMLDNSERAMLQNMIKRRMVTYFKKSGEREAKYGISKELYNNYLYRKKPQEAQAGQMLQASQPQQPRKQVISQSPRAWEQKMGSESYMQMLEANGFLVLSNEAEASSMSAALEDSIRHGLVVGTRAFNKKFYIGLRGYINRFAPKILNVIEQKSRNISDIAKEVGMEEDGARTVLYYLSESGDVTEVRRDMFRAA